MKQIIFPATAPRNTRLPLALWRPEPADAPPGRGPGAHAGQGCGNCGGCGKCKHEEKQARTRPRHGLPPVPQSAAAGT